MLVSVLASGSKGNSTLIKTKEHKILVDAGMSVKYLEDKLRLAEVLIKDNVNSLNYILSKYGLSKIKYPEFETDILLLPSLIINELFENRSKKR